MVLLFHTNTKTDFWVLTFYSIWQKNPSDTSTDTDEIDQKPKLTAKRQKRIGPQKWDGLPCKQGNKLPEGIDGLCCFKVTLDDKNNRTAALQDGRKWKKDSRTEWNGYKILRFANCSGSYKCTNLNCIYKVEWGVVNTLQFIRKETTTCSLCGEKALLVNCDARRYLIVKNRHINVYHHGEHTCTVRKSRPTAPKEDIRDFIKKKSYIKPTQVQSAYILSMLRNGEDWDKVDKQASRLLKKQMDCQPKVRSKEGNGAVRPQLWSGCPF